MGCRPGETFACDATTSAANTSRSLLLIADRPGFDFYELRHAAATMLLERGTTPWDVAIQLGHTDGGKLVMSTATRPKRAHAPDCSRCGTKT